MNPNSDTDYLRLHSIFHYVIAGLLALFSLFPVIHLVLGIAMVTGALDDFANGDPFAPVFGWFFVLIPLVFIVCGLTLAGCVAMAGRQLAAHSAYTYCLVIACIECIFMPFGTVLGVLTIIVLTDQA